MSQALEQKDAVEAGLKLEEVAVEVGKAIEGKRAAIRLALCAIVGGGHLLIEDLPGVGKTTLAQALSRALGLDFARVQFTSDLLPSDVIGAQVFDQREAAFSFRPGPVFARVVLADEINRAP
ncbi:MAG: AAA family ATPase, partial [Myxococcaceae bacterium]|nr:AAA family ATPase [Myxococcaceae bacterium]